MAVFAVSRRMMGERQSRRMPGGAPSPILFGVDFTSAPLGAMANATFLSTFGLSFSRASAATVQTSASTVDSTPTNDVPRFGYDGTRRGLVLEESRQNLLTQSRLLSDAAWSYTGTVIGGQSSPDGTSSGSRCQVAPTTYCGYQNAVSSNATNFIMSAWARAASGGSSLESYYGSPAPALINASTSTTYSRYKAPVCSTNTGGTNVVVLDGRGTNGLVSGTYDNVVDLIQCEYGNFASEAIVTAAATATRAGERLWSASASGLVDSGRVGFYTSLRPKGATANYAANMYLWYVDANNNAYATSAGAVVVTVGGVAQTLNTSPASWAAGDTVELWVEAGGGTRATTAKVRVNGGVVSTIGTNGTPLGNVTPATMDLLCNGTGNQLTAWVQQIQFFKSGYRPAGF